MSTITSPSSTSTSSTSTNGRSAADATPAHAGVLTALGMRSATTTVERPEPRVISNAVSARRLQPRDKWGRSEFVWAWGQFLDHELVLVGKDASAPKTELAIPDDDPMLEFRGTTMQFEPSLRIGGQIDGQIPNGHTAVLDASNVYGVDPKLQNRLRAAGGYLATSVGRHGRPMLPRDGRFYVAGDERANEHGVLTAMHTVFVREHNHWVDHYRAVDPTLDDEALFERARRIVVAEIQAITCRGFLPAVLGPSAMPAYDDFDPAVDPSISNVFATAAYRFGHSMVRDDVSVSVGDHRISLADVFFNPEYVDRLGIEPFLSQLAYRRIEAIDTAVVPGLRNTLFTRGSSPTGLLDLVALNIQRGRDHGLPTFNTCRRYLGLAPITSFADLTDDRRIVTALERVYDDIDQLDLWVAGLAEQPRDGRRVGDFLHGFIVDQFRRSRDGDPNWFERDGVLSSEERCIIDQTTLATVLRRTTGIGFAGDVFHVPR